MFSGLTVLEKALGLLHQEYNWGEAAGHWGMMENRMQLMGEEDKFLCYCKGTYESNANPEAG